MDRRIKYRHIECFLEVCRQKSLKVASERLALSQPAVSKTLKELEDILKVTLLTRSRAGVALTREGEVFFHFAQTSLAALQQAVNQMQTVQQQGRRRLSVGALPSVAVSLMPEATREFTRLAPDVTLRIFDGPHRYLIDQLRSGDIDLAIGRLGTADLMQGVSFTQLYTEVVAFVVRPGHPILSRPELARIADYPVVFPSEGSVIRPLVESYLIAQGVGEIPVRVETVSGAFGRVYTAQSDAVWIISSGVVANELAEGRLIRLPFDTDVTAGPVGLMARPDTLPLPEADMFRLAVQNAARSLGFAVDAIA